MTKKKFFKILTKLGFVGTDASIKVSLYEYGMIYSEKLSQVILWRDGDFYYVAYNIDADFIKAAYNHNKAEILKADCGFEPQTLVGKLGSFIIHCSLGVLNLKEVDGEELCGELLKMLYRQNSVKIMEFVNAEPRFENVSIEEETETEQGVLRFTLDEKDHHFIFEGLSIKGGQINSGMVRIAHQSKLIDVLKNILL